MSHATIKVLTSDLSQIWGSSLYVPGATLPTDKPASIAITSADMDLIDKIVRRFSANAHKANRGVVVRAARQALMACHGTGITLDLQALLSAKSPAFREAVASLMRYINPTTGEALKGFVVPFRKGA